VTGLHIAHVAGMPVEETLGSLAPALLLAFSAASAALRARVATRSRRAPRRVGEPEPHGHRYAGEPDRDLGHP
jgi:hypothetical protein